MTLPCEVLEEVEESFTGKRGPKIIRLWVCLDRSPGKTLRNTVDYEVSAEEQEKFGGKAVGKLVELAISDIHFTFVESPDIYTLSKLRWQFFGSLTILHERMPERVRITMFFALVCREELSDGQSLTPR